MYEHDTHRHHGRTIPRGHHHDGRRDARRDVRHGAATMPFSLRDLFGRGRPGATIRRGEIRPLILGVLLEKPMHGYEVIQVLEAESGGRWRPSAGSVYPTLQLLADEGLVTSEEVDGRRTYTLTDEGRAAAETSAARPWTDGEEDREQDTRQLAMQLAGAVMQVHRMGSPQARSEARRILSDARRQMYRLLAEDEEPGAEGGPDEGESASV